MTEKLIKSKLLKAGKVKTYNIPTGGGGCPSPEMEILLSSGESIKAGDIKVGDQVKTRHETTDQEGIWPVTAVEILEDQRWFVKVKDGREFIGTFNHRFLTTYGWIEIQNLKEGDIICGMPDGIVDIAKFLDTGPVVKITVDDAHTYVCQGLVSHNIKAIENPLRVPPPPAPPPPSGALKTVK